MDEEKYSDSSMPAPSASADPSSNATDGASSTPPRSILTNSSEGSSTQREQRRQGGGLISFLKDTGDEARRRSSDIEMQSSTSRASLRGPSEVRGNPNPLREEPEEDVDDQRRMTEFPAKQSSESDLLEAIGTSASPKVFSSFARSMPRHELMSLAAHALDALAEADRDALDYDIEETGDIEKAAISNKRRASNTAVDQALDDLAKLEEAFVHVEQRFHKRLTAGAGQHMSHQDMSLYYDESDHQKPEEGKPEKKRDRALTMTMVWNHHREGGLFVFYEIPKVRRLHEDHEHEYVVDWADLFFDLSYVAGAFKLGVMLKSDVSIRGFCYFVVLAVSMIELWRFKTIHDSTFEATDIFHKIIDILYCASVGSVAIFIQPLTNLEDMNSGYAFGLCASLLVASVIIFIEKLEIVLVSTSTNAVFDCSMELMLEVAPRMSGFLAAVIIAGLGYNESTSTSIPYGDPYGGGNKSELPRKYSFEIVNYLLVAGLVMSNALPLCGYLFKLLPPNRIRWHAEHIAHRYAEWVMMVLGESVLSAILAPVHNRLLYYLSFWAALLIAQTLQFVHYSSEEFDMNKHALGRKLRAGRLWMALMTVYSVALIGFGTGVKALLYSVVCQSGSYRMLAASSSYGGGDDEPGKVSDDDGKSDYCEAAPSNYVQLVCLSHVAQYLAQQVSLPLHEGAAEYIWHFLNYSQRSVYYIIGSKCATIVAMLVLAFTDHQLQSHALLLAILAITMVQGLTQTIENMIMHVRKQDKIDTKPDKTVIKRSSSSFYRFYNETAGSVVPKSWIKMLSSRSTKKTDDSQANTQASKELKCIPTQQEDFISKSPIGEPPILTHPSEPLSSI